jgi:putative phosphoribosyl transferase
MIDHALEFDAHVLIFVAECRPDGPIAAYAADIANAPGNRTFQDRREAGRVLARHLTAYGSRSDVTVLGLARGGVPVGREVAIALRAPLEVFLVRKLGVPQWSELAMGAIASGGGVVLNEPLIESLHISSAALDEAIARESAELRRRESAYRSGREPMDLHGRVAVLVDDGIATGASMKAAVAAVRSLGPAAVVVAVPVGPRAVCGDMRSIADDVVCAVVPDRFRAVGQVYADFHQVDDDEVREALATAS